VSSNPVTTKKKLRANLKLILQFFPFWQMFKIYSTIVERLYCHKVLLTKDLREYSENQLKQGLFKTPEVIRGVFKGLKYPDLISFGSTLFPKLAGTYEYCLKKYFESEDFQKYQLIVDIGCAEGYYAIGSLLINKSAEVIAIDTDPKALLFCEEMAKLNNVQQRITFRSEFVWSLLDGHLQKNKQDVLIICDCEGCEFDLFDATYLPVIRSCNFIIELHDFVKPGAKEKLISEFNATHEVHIETEIEDPHFRMVPWAKSLQREITLSEHRPLRMEWMILRKRG
jgi:hypothetical protein